MRRTPLILLGVFLVPRLFIAFFVPPYVSDVALYQQIAANGLLFGKTAYLDFFWPYPPLSLSWIYAASFIGLDYDSYRMGFHLISLLIDSAMHLLLWRICKECFQFPDKTTIQVFVWSSTFALFQPNLLYDRIDLGVSFFLVLILFRILKHPEQTATNSAIAVAGALFKFIPGLLIPLIAARTRGIRSDAETRNRIFLLCGVSAVVFVLLAWAYDLAIGGGLLSALLDHGERGIQIESVWATPFLLAGVFASLDVGILNNHGAQHLSEAMASPIYLFLTKVLGWVLLGAFVLRELLSPPRVSPSSRLTQFLALILIFLSTQRVLSPQFFIWLAPLAAIHCALYKSRLEKALFFSVYLLTFVEFDLGYWKLVSLDPKFVLAVSARNLLLVFLAWKIVAQSKSPVSR